jgi:hypothetical protein
MPEINEKPNERRGGRRPGAGRKPSTIKGVARKLPKDTAALILAEIKANRKWVELTSSEDEYIVLGALKYLTDRAFGKAKQSIETTGDGGGPVLSEIKIKFMDAPPEPPEDLR